MRATGGNRQEPVGIENPKPPIVQFENSVIAKVA
jgi:hypothetical protein